MSLKKIVIKTPEEIEGMRAACRDAALVLDFIEPYVKAGVTTEELDDLMLKYMTEELKDISACLGYSSGGETPYPKATCISVNHQICHGIPDQKVLKKGDILNIDVTVIKNGFHGDTSRMFKVEPVSIAASRLCEITFNAMWKGICSSMLALQAALSLENSVVTAWEEVSTKNLLSHTLGRWEKVLK